MQAEFSSIEGAFNNHEPTLGQFRVVLWSVVSVLGGALCIGLC